MKFGISDGYNKTETLNNKSAIKLFMAKNEGESCVISVLSPENIEGASLVFKDFYEDILVETEKEYFVSCNGRNFPDPLAPIEKFDIKANELTSILVRFTTNVQTEAGEYKYNISLEGTDFEFFVELKVWNFSLPEKYVVNVSMDLYRDQIGRMHKTDDEDEIQRLYELYYEKLLKFRVSPFVLPYDILDDRADKFMSDPRLTAFNMDKDVSADDETLIKYYQKLTKNPDWAKKAMIYPIDEPLTKEHLDTLISACGRAKRLCPDIRCTSAFFRDIPYDENNDEVQILIDNCDLILPKLTCFNDEFIYEQNPEHLEKYGSFQDRITEAQKNGKEIWQYVCWEPGKPYVNMYVDESGLDHRILFWQQHLVGATGFLYWTTNHWRFIESPWKDMATVPDLSPDVFGDGSLLYNGNEVGVDGACASVRLEAVRNGIEDCEMLLIADKILGREWVLEKVKMVTRDLKNYTESPEVFNQIRMGIGNAIEEKIK